MSEVAFPIVKLSIEVYESNSDCLKVEYSDNGGINITKKAGDDPDDIGYVGLSPLETASLKKFLENIEYNT